MVILKVSFILLLISFFFGEVIRFQLGNGIAFTVNTIFIGVTAGIWLLYGSFQKKLKYYLSTPITKPLVIFISIALFSLFINLKGLSFFQFFTSFLYLARWVMIALIFFVVLRFDTSFKQIIRKLVVVVGAIIVSVGFFQYFLYPNLRNLFYLGWDEHMHRMFSTFFDPNYLGAFLVLYFIFIVSLFFKRPSVAYGLLLLLTFLAILLTFSRSAILMLTVSGSLYLALNGKKKWLIFLLGSILFFFIASSRYFYIENINPFRIVSSEARLETARNAIDLFKGKPILGVGFNTYKYAQVRHGFRKEKEIFKSHADASPDNSLLFVLATTGILGFVAYIYLGYSILRNSTPLISASLMGLFVNSFFINSLFYPFIMVWMWVIIGLNEKRD